MGTAWSGEVDRLNRKRRNHAKAQGQGQGHARHRGRSLDPGHEAGRRRGRFQVGQIGDHSAVLEVHSKGTDAPLSG